MFINILLRLMIYMDLFMGIALMVIACNKLGSHPASLIFNIDAVSKNADTGGFFLSLFSSLWYITIKALDFISIIALIPIIQFTLTLTFRKILGIYKQN
ncbi:hypothetical protein EXM65_12910 [Clostridium botulinum]|uniref:Uncharacterized protein n=1 Tax=Clostridium botulinum TaxID=1491 RepID=A0A6M0SQ63_CLOBO|nr:hypothetical protein [Clostridium botulinum]